MDASRSLSGRASVTNCRWKFCSDFGWIDSRRPRSRPWYDAGMALSDEDVKRLKLAFREAWKASSHAASANPKPGTPEWEHWKKLHDAANAASKAHLKALKEHLRGDPGTISD